MVQIPGLPTFDPARTAFLLTSATSGTGIFEAQADRLPIFQLSALLRDAGVPIHRIWVDLPIVPGQTVDAPLAHPDCPPLHLPQGLQPLFIRQGRQNNPDASRGMLQWQNVAAFFDEQDRDPGVDKVVWVYLNHGRPEGIFFPGLRGPDMIEPKDLAKLLLGFANTGKSTLIIMDACFSGNFAELTLSMLAQNGYSAPLAFLTSSDHECETSAIVLSTEFTPDLASKSVPRTGSKMVTHFNYRVGHPMFTRAWLRQFAYEKGSVKFVDLPNLLGSSLGFSARYRSNSPVMKNAVVGAFFPPRVQPINIVRNYGTVISFGEVILPERLGQLYDDFEPELWPEVRAGATPYVLLGSTDPADLRDRSPGSPAVLLRDFLFNEVRDVVKAFHAGDARGNERAGETVRTDGTPRRHFSLRGIIYAIIPELKQNDPNRQFDLAVSRDARRWPWDLIYAVRRLNGNDPGEGPEEGMLAGWTVGLATRDVMELIIHARRRYARCYRMPVDDEEWPDFGNEDLNVALAPLRDPATTTD
jgi:hypothetical protein